MESYDVEAQLLLKKLWLFLKIWLNCIYFLLAKLAKANCIWLKIFFTFSQNGYSVSLLRVTPGDSTHLIERCAALANLLFQGFQAR